jgi:hypothetical protein
MNFGLGTASELPGNLYTSTAFMQESVQATRREASALWNYGHFPKGGDAVFQGRMRAKQRGEGV